MTWKESFKQAVALHQAGDLAQAEQLYRDVLAANGANYPVLYHLAFLLYQRQRAEAALEMVEAALRLQPNASEALALHSVLLLSSGRHEEALTSVSKVTAREPGDAEAWNNQGVILAALRRFEEALTSFDKALAIKPTMFAALYRRATALMELKRHAEAIAAFDIVLAQKPDVLDAWGNRGLTLYEMERFAESLDCFERATRLDPNYAPAWTNRGKALDKLERFDEALASYDKAIAISPDNANAWYARAVTLRTMHRFEPALEAVNKALEQRPGRSPMLQLRGWLLCELGRITDGLTEIQRAAEVSLKGAHEPPSSEHKRRHDAEQRDYLAQRGVFLKNGDFHLADGRNLGAPAVNSGNARAAAAQWDASRPRIVVIDDFLTPAALQRLREFCWGSTVWRMSYPGGYLGAMAEDGFANPLLAQIAEELRDSFPTIIGDHPLRKVWGYKYDSRHDGIGVHADQAAVNVNFWITADEANRNPESGGMVIWSAAAPKEWNFKDYNGDEAAVREFLARSGAKRVTVPHRANRAVIFDSDLFHETDTIAFKDGYLNRRINVTMLYGRRTYYGA